VRSGTTGKAQGEPVEFEAADGYLLHGHHWPVADDDGRRPAVVLCAATGVAARYYGRYAAWLASHGLPVLTFDYRGIGASRYGSLRGLRATKHDWGALDTDAAIRQLAALYPQRTRVGVGHSIGGFCLGLAPSNVLLSRLLLVGSQYAYWPDYAPAHRFGYFMRWHVLMPLLAATFGYFPGKTPRLAGGSAARCRARMGAAAVAGVRPAVPLAARCIRQARWRHRTCCVCRLSGRCTRLRSGRRSLCNAGGDAAPARLVLDCKNPSGAVPACALRSHRNRSLRAVPLGHAAHACGR
jgi:hypothetical protein